MGFGKLQSTGKYSYYVQYVNEVAKLIKDAKMTPMAFNDGIYFNNDTEGGTFDTDIVICYWSSGWGTYNPMPASTLDKMGFRLVNTDGSYYWVLGKTDTQCSANKASGFKKNSFPGNSTINTPAGSMFCIWADYPGAETEAGVISKTAATIAAFGKALPEIGIKSTSGTALTLNGSTELTVPGNAEATWSVSPAGVIELQASGNADERSAITGTSVVAKAVGTGTATVTATVDGKQYSTTLTVTDPTVKNIYVTVGGTATETETGDVTGSVDATGYDSRIASYKPKYVNTPAVPRKNLGNKITMDSDATYTGVISDGTNYLVIDSNGNVSNTTEIADATEFTVTRKTTSEWWSTTTTYTIQGNGKYLDVTRSYPEWNYKLSTSDNSADWSYDSSSGFFKNYYYLTYNNGWTVARNSGNGFLYTVKDDSTPAKNETQITFTGKSVGDTSIKIGDVTYKIHVVAEDLSKVTPLPVEYWITNQKVTGSDGAESKTISAASAYGENGVLFSKLVPATGTQDGKNDVFWKGTRLTSDNKQTEGKGVDKTTSGNDFTYIRYWNQKWSFSADGKSWTDFNSNDQVVAYYLQKTTVTDEVTTEVVDWGELWSGYNDSKYVIVDYAVKYQSGTRSPDSFPVTGKTLGFHCNDSTDLNKSVFLDSATNKYYRSIGMIKGEGTADYEVYMITLTPTSDSASTTLKDECSSNKSITYGGTEKVVWVDNEKNLGAFADESLHYTSISGKIKYSVGGEPIVPGLEIYNQHGMLVTYYVREKETPDSLHVHYIDTTGSSSNEFYSYAINVHQNTTFDANIGLNNPWKGDLKNGTVTNVADKEQTVSANLSTMPAIGASYKYSKYTCNKVERSENGKDVYLYYTFNNKVSFVVDFGLPLKINLSDLNASLANANVTSVKVEGAKYGKTAYADKVVTYTPTETINAIDTLSVTVSGRITYTDENGKEVTKNDTVSYMVDVIPATSVYYEDSFATFTNANGTKNVAQADNADKGIWTKVTDGTTQTNVNQALEALGGTTNTKNVYGYDPAYANSSKFSMGSATKVTVAANTADNGHWPTATFTFKGTGFDVISLTNSDAGTVMYTVTNAVTNEKVMSRIIDNYYGYTYENNQWVVKENDSTAPYQVPVIKISGLDYGTYTVTISVIYGELFDNTGDNQYSFWLDAVRVYNPAGNTLDSEYTKDGENNPNYVEVKKVILDSKALETDGATGATGAVFIDGKSENVSATEYANQGPNHEAYLAKNQAIAFQMLANETPTSVQIGAKLASGDSANLQISGANCNKATSGKLQLTTATDMYYELAGLGWTEQADGTYLSNVITLTNTGAGIVSLTNIKFIGAVYQNVKPEVKASADETTVVTFAASEAMVDEAVAVVDGVINPVIEPFNPDRFDVSWSRNVRKGDTAKLTVKTSEDVEAITVNGETIDSYVERNERTGWGWWAKTVTYREFTYTTKANVTEDFTVCAVNAEGVSSEAKTATLTVRPSVRDWLHGIIGKWF